MNVRVKLSQKRKHTSTDAGYNNNNSSTGNVNNMGTTHEAREVGETHKDQCARSTVFIKYVSMVGK
jgi:hypothetical protein